MSNDGQAYIRRVEETLMNIDDKTKRNDHRMYSNFQKRLKETKICICHIIKMQFECSL